MKLSENMKHLKALQIEAFQDALNKDVQAKVIKIVNQIHSTFDKGQGIAFFGNGGSAAESTHFAAEFTGKCVKDHKPCFAISLNDSISAMTAITNDYGFDYIFSRQVEALKGSLGIVFGLSTSGKSPNVLRGLESAKKIGAMTVLMTGNSLLHPTPDFVDISLCVKSSSTPRIQEVHLFWGHLIAELVEENLP
jgi:D-sedoheptulose 7-phosphate isomerase